MARRRFTYFDVVCVGPPLRDTGPGSSHGSPGSNQLHDSERLTERFDRSTSPGNYPRRIYAAPMASAELSRRVEKVVAYPPLSEMSDLQRREFHEALLDTDSFEDLPGKWQAANLKAEQNRTNLRIVTSD